MDENDKLPVQHPGLGNNVNDILQQLDYRGNLKFRFSALQHRSVTSQRDYGNGQPIKMLDAHILKDIDEYPGIRSVELAKNWCRARSAICVIIQRLEEQGYVRKDASKGSKRDRALFVTEKGRELCQLHRQYDAMQTSKMIHEMLHYCTAEEIDAYFKVLDYQIQIMQRGYSVDKDGVPIFQYEETETE